MACQFTKTTKVSTHKEISWTLQDHTNCNTKQVIYTIECPCGLLYVGKTMRAVKTRIGEHRSCIKNKVPDKPLVEHYVKKNHTNMDIKWCVLQKVNITRRGGDIDKTLTKLEQKWVHKLRTVKEAYPWDKSSLKSLEIDMKKFKKLDAYATKVDVKGNEEKLVEVLLKEAHTDLEKVRAIWIWICHHIEYDLERYHNKEEALRIQTDMMQKRKAMCGGYSRLLLQMCSAAKVKCMLIPGNGRGHSFRKGQTLSGESNHAWNVVYLDERWHLLDCTWGAGNVNDTHTEFKFGYNELYFLTHPAIFIEDHFPENKDWQLLSSPLSVAEFAMNVRRENSFYNMGLHTSSPGTTVIKTVNGKSEIYIEGRYPTLFAFDLNGSEQCGLMTLQRLGMKLEVYPQATGSHRLQIYAKPVNSQKSTYTMALAYVVECNSVDNTMKIPKEMQNPVGPSWLSLDKGFLLSSHPDPVIQIMDGCCSISFNLKGNIDTYATLHTDDMPKTQDVERRHIFQWQQEKRVVFKIRLPQAGIFLLKVFSKTKSDHGQRYTYALNYVLTCTNQAVKWPVFPVEYGSWLTEWELIEPVDGILPANRDVHFKLKIPGVICVFVKNKKAGSLSLKDNGYWEGTFNTAGSQEVDVMLQKSTTSSHYAAILGYQVTIH
ncbi:kyphoscoliosis peptidase-like [Ambystoma mexicanum]|uniref:kyphoscoliosis peptidase-like n=1 Tax=Ambystoma mexicanum TaxID=8296 RepID=UPI0037E8326D